jgi:hypothetical protein
MKVLDKREEKKEGKRTRWTEEERERIRDWIKARVSPLMVYEKYDGRPVRREGTCYKALCPFHPDNNPSLAIYEDGFFKCYAGCEFDAGKERKQRGDIFDFVQKWVLEKEGKRITFDEAMERIIKDFSLALPPKSPVEAFESHHTKAGVYNTTTTTSKASLTALQPQNQVVSKGKQISEEKPRGLTLRDYKNYCGIVSEEIRGMSWWEYFSLYGELTEGLWSFREEEFKQIAAPFTRYKEAIKRGEMVPCVRFGLWKLEAKGLSRAEEVVRVRWDAPGGFHHRRGDKMLPYGLQFFLIPEWKESPVWICEGESDALLFSILGFIPFSLPGKTNWKLAVEYLPRLFELYGKRPVYVLVEPDAIDEMAKLRDALKGKGIETTCYLFKDLETFEGFKDLREWWCDFSKKEGRDPSYQDFIDFLNSQGGDNYAQNNQ